MNTNLTGNIAEAKVLAKFIEKGWPVLLPFGNSEPYDMVIDRGNGFEKVQVKNGRYKNGTVEFNAYTSDRKGKSISYYGLADLFATYCADLDKVFVIPVDESPANVVIMRIDPPKNNQIKDIRWANEYLI